MPRCRDLAIFVWTMTTNNDKTDHFTPCAYAQGKIKRKRERERSYTSKRFKCSGPMKVSISRVGLKLTIFYLQGRALIHYTTVTAVVLNYIVLWLGNIMVHSSKLKAKIK